MQYVVTKNKEKGSIYDGKTVVNDLQECFNIVKPGDYIYLRNETYFGKVTLRCKDITMVGMDESIITYDAYHQLKIRKEDGGDGEKVYGTTGSATFTVKPDASNFRMYNVTVENSHKRMSEINGNQGVAFKTEAIEGYYEECKFLGEQDTLYVDNNDNVFLKCYVTGTVDFIFGKGNAIFDQCKIIAKEDICENYFIAPNTWIVNSYGYLFYKCSFKGTTSYKTYLGRPWFDTGAKMEVVPRALFYECQFSPEVVMEFTLMRKQETEKHHELNTYKCIQSGKEFTTLKDEKIVDFYEKIYSQRRY